MFEGVMEKLMDLETGVAATSWAGECHERS